MKFIKILYVSIVLSLLVGFTTYAAEEEKADIILGPGVTISNNTEGPTSIISDENINNSENEEVTQQEPEKLSYTEEDLQYMIMVLTGECQGLPFEIQLEYASVVMNRKNDPSYPNTIKGVCLQKGQYSCFRDGNAYRTPTAASIEAAKYILENGSISPANVVYQSHGRQGSGIYKQIGREKFCFK